MRNTGYLKDRHEFRYPRGMGTPAQTKVARWMKIGATISGGLGAIVMPIWLLISDIRSDIRDAEYGSEAVVQGLAPAVQELQDLAKNFVPWAKGYDRWREDVDEDSKEREKEMRYLRERVVQLETYIRYSSRGRFKPAAPEEEKMLPDLDMDGVEDRTPSPGSRIEEPRAPVVQSVQGAKKLRRARKANKCPDSDPQCGAEVLEN